MKSKKFVAQLVLLKEQIYYLILQIFFINRWHLIRLVYQCNN